MVEKQNIELKLIHMEDVVSKEVKWLWYPYIPYGKITIIEGDPGEEKTTLVLKLAAALSRGLPLPCDDDKEYEPIAVILITLILSYFTLVFGELVPKRIAMKNLKNWQWEFQDWLRESLSYLSQSFHFFQYQPILS